ncbi:MAG TPA: Hsp20/alpha crystallin family protein [Thermodesulfobacteriaceae bacterium]|nr:Hsp20/alpha crystallin family protein [Thermodesulfobacteriaceae bacterium]
MTDTREAQVAIPKEKSTAKAYSPGPRQLVPPVDIYENDDGIILLADMPGITKDSLDIQIEKDVLTIRGTIESFVPEGIKPLYAEFTGGEYQRSFTLGPDLDVSRIEANMNAGVLRMVLPKAEAVKPRRIEIKVD